MQKLPQVWLLERSDPSRGRRGQSEPSARARAHGAPAPGPLHVPYILTVAGSSASAPPGTEMGRGGGCRRRFRPTPSPESARSPSPARPLWPAPFPRLPFLRASRTPARPRSVSVSPPAHRGCGGAPGPRRRVRPPAPARGVGLFDLLQARRPRARRCPRDRPLDVATQAGRATEARHPGP